jgi:NAD(P)-dependent dehydrogenase (short-subunit alcohol dehydrogenase family)
MDVFSLKGKVAVVTGAAGLLGKQHCEALAEAGAHVIVCDLSPPSCEQLAADLPTVSLGCKLDVTSQESLRNLMTKVLRHFDGIDILINNAAINDMFESPAAAAEQSKFENYPLELWQRSLDVNVTGIFNCCQILGTHMAKRGRGSIVNIASTYGVVAPDQSIYIDENGEQKFFKSPAYPATKGAVISFTRFLAAYWGKAGIRVNCLSPGGVRNGQATHFVENYGARTPLGRMAAPTDYRGAIVFLASEASVYMTGANLVVDGGWTAW